VPAGSCVSAFARPGVARNRRGRPTWRGGSPKRSRGVAGELFLGDAAAIPPRSRPGGALPLTHANVAALDAPGLTREGESIFTGSVAKGKSGRLRPRRRGLAEKLAKRRRSLNDDTAPPHRGAVRSFLQAGAQSARPHRAHLRTSMPITDTGLPGLWPTSKQRRRRIAAPTVSGMRPDAEIPRTFAMSVLERHPATEGRNLGSAWPGLDGTGHARTDRPSRSVHLRSARECRRDTR
jgi:hypothetical protein